MERSRKSCGRFCRERASVAKNSPSDALRLRFQNADGALLTGPPIRFGHIFFTRSMVLVMSNDSNPTEVSSRNYDVYESPLVARNASQEMIAVFSPQRKHSTWRRIWLALAEAEKTLGLPITDEQLNDMRAHLDDIDFEEATRQEMRVRHDLMAHLHTFAIAAPRRKPILHLGATSMDIVDNTDVLLTRDALTILAQKIANLIDALGTFATKNRDLPCLSYTHLQPAQPTTVGKRPCFGLMILCWFSRILSCGCRR